MVFFVNRGKGLSTLGKDSNFIRVLKNVIFPRRCVFCRRFLALDAGTGVCIDCMNKIPFNISYHHCKGCGRPIPEGRVYCADCARGERYAFAKVHAAYLYEEPARLAMIRFKREWNHSFAAVFAEHMAEIIRREVSLSEIDLVVAVPPRKERMRRMDYDQALNLAMTLAKILELPCLGGVMRQKEKRRKQSSLSYEERRRNVQGNFLVVKKEAVAGKRILLVDDICTTGATLNECAKVLRCAGAKTVVCAVAAITGEE